MKSLDFGVIELKLRAGAAPRGHFTGWVRSDTPAVVCDVRMKALGVSWREGWEPNRLGVRLREGVMKRLSFNHEPIKRAQTSANFHSLFKMAKISAKQAAPRMPLHQQLRRSGWFDAKEPAPRVAVAGGRHQRSRAAATNAGTSGRGGRLQVIPQRCQQVLTTKKGGQLVLRGQRCPHASR